MADGRIDEAEEMAAMAVSTLDKAAAKGVLHPRNVSRRKSRLMKALNEAKESTS